MMEARKEYPEFRKVVIATPDRRAHGGIASVTAAYTRNYAGPAYIETNSRHGSIAGAVKLVCALAKLPILRIGGRNILHIHSAAGKSFTRKRIVMAWGRMLGYKIIFHSHSGLFTDTVEQLGAERVRQILKPCSRIAVLSPTWKDYFGKLLGRQDVTVVNNIIEAPELGRTPATDKVEFLFMGLLMERKGIFDLLEAVKPLAREYAGRFTLVVGGAHGEEARFLEMISEEPLSSCVKYVGWLDEEGKARQLATATAIVLPSHAEGVPISILEGFVRGIPAIASAVGGIPDMMETDVEGILVPVGDVEALRSALRRYIEEPATVQRHGEAALKRAQGYMPGAVAEQLRELYKI